MESITCQSTDNNLFGLLPRDLLVYLLKFAIAPPHNYDPTSIDISKTGNHKGGNGWNLHPYDKIEIEEQLASRKKSVRFTLLQVCKYFNEICLTYIFPPWEQNCKFRVRFDSTTCMKVPSAYVNFPQVTDGYIVTTGLQHAILFQHSEYYVKWAAVAALRWNPSKYYCVLEPDNGFARLNSAIFSLLEHPLQKTTTQDFYNPFLAACKYGTGTILQSMFNHPVMKPDNTIGSIDITMASLELNDHFDEIKVVGRSKPKPKKKVMLFCLHHAIFSGTEPTRLLFLLDQSITNPLIDISLITNNLLFKTFKKGNPSAGIILLRSAQRYQLLLDPSFNNNKILKLLTLQDRVELARIFLEDSRVIAAGVHHCLELIITAGQLPKWGLGHIVESQKRPAACAHVGGFHHGKYKCNHQPSSANAGDDAKLEYLFRPSADMTTLFSNYLDGYRSEFTDMEISDTLQFGNDADFN